MTRVSDYKCVVAHYIRFASLYLTAKCERNKVKPLLHEHNNTRQTPATRAPKADK